MRRWIGSLFAALLLALPLLALDNPANGKKEDRAKQFREMEKTRTDLVKAYEKAETDEERQKIVEKYLKLRGEVPKLMKMVEENPKDDLACDMLVFVLQMDQRQHDKVFELLTEHHAANPKLATLFSMLGSQPPQSAEKLMKKALKENPSKEVKGYACYGLAQLNIEKADKGDKKAVEEAEDLLKRVQKDYADIELRDSTLGKEAKTGLFYVQNLVVGKKAPNVESKDLEDKKVQLSDYKGKVVVLDIWATWCPPCKAMIPHERDMVKKLKDKPFALISISADAKKKTLTDFIEKESMPWTHWWNGQSGGIIKEWNVQFFPTIYVLDCEGVIRYKNIRGKELEEAVEKLLAEAKAGK